MSEFPKAKIYFWIFAALSLIILLAPLRQGDLAGYDDALYAHIAKHIVRSGDWMNLSSNGYAAFEHPPVFDWMEAALFRLFGFSDALARLPSALCGFGTILLVYWLAKRLTGNAVTGICAMLAMASSIYFLKYAERAMTDVPFTFFLLCALCAWVRTKDDNRWYLMAGLATAVTQMTRGLMGLALPLIFLTDVLITRRRPPLRYAGAALAIAFLPLLGWYAYLISEFGDMFFRVHAAFLERDISGGLQPEWRRYTGAFEYAWMLGKSYWPWLPATLAGLVLTIRRRERHLWLLAIWAAVVFVLCAAAGSRVLRYMLPAYPAFAILAAHALTTLIPEQRLTRSLRFATPVLAVLALAVAAFPRVHLQAEETRPLALAATRATPPNDRIGFFDAGQQRFDETNQLQWYGDRYLIAIFDRAQLRKAILQHAAPVFIVDRETYREDIQGKVRNRVVAERGHLVCFSLPPASS